MRAKPFAFDATDRTAALLCVLFGLVFLVLSILSPSVHNDDELSRYFNVRAVPGSWDQVLSLWNRPAFVLLYLLPARLGYGAIEAMTALISALTCFLTYRIARKLDWRPPWLAVFFVACQPFFLGLSFSGLTEPLAACLLAGSLMLLLDRRFLASALVLSAVPLARLELVFLFLPWAYQLGRQKAWRALAVMPLGLVFWNLAGFLHTNDAAFLWHQIFTNEERLYQPVGLTHYLSGYIFIVGPVVFALSLLGLVESLRRRSDTLISAGTLLMLAVYTWLSSHSSTGQSAGFLRHPVTLAPFTALLALRGYGLWAAPRVTLTTLVTLAVAAVACGLFLSVGLVSGMQLGRNAEYGKLLVVSILAAIVLIRTALRRRRRGLPAPEATVPTRGAGILAFVAAALAAGFVAAHPPIQRLTPEQQTMCGVARWFDASRFNDRIVLCNHVWFYYCAGISPNAPRSRALTKAALEAAPPQSIAIWEGHYAHRLMGDLSRENVDRLHGWRAMQRFVDRKEGFYAVALEKLREEDRLGRIGSGGYEHPGYRIRWDAVGNAPGWQWTIEPEGLRLLHGTNDWAQLDLKLGRSIDPVDPRVYLGDFEAELGNTAGVTVERIDEVAEWRVIWGHQGAQGFCVALLMDYERGETLWLTGECESAKLEALRGAVTALLPSLRFEPA